MGLKVLLTNSGHNSGVETRISSNCLEGLKWKTRCIVTIESNFKMTQFLSSNGIFFYIFFLWLGEEKENNLIRPDILLQLINYNTPDGSRFDFLSL